jgi:hypothetical protein
MVEIAGLDVSVVNLYGAEFNREGGRHERMKGSWIYIGGYQNIKAAFPCISNRHHHHHHNVLNCSLSISRGIVSLPGQLKIACDKLN